MEENPQRPLVLHTLPSSKERPVLSKNVNAQPDTAPLHEPDTNPVEETPAEEPDRKKRKIARPTATIPRLVSVVEIIKREYGKWASTRQAPDGGPPDESLRLGLHQYNELATLEDLGLVEGQEHGPDDVERLRLALEGKNLYASQFLLPDTSSFGEISLKQKFTPHLKVTLSVCTQPMLEARGAT